jgi:hypothetical protein
MQLPYDLILLGDDGMKGFVEIVNEERPDLVNGGQQADVHCPRIRPGDWGKAVAGWLPRALLRPDLNVRPGGRIHQFLWRRSRAVSNAKNGTER